MEVPILKVKTSISATIVKRVNRFVVEVEFRGIRERVHINNTGRLEEYIVKGRRAFLRPLKNLKKTSYRLFAIEEKGSGALIDTQLQMDAFLSAHEMGLIPWLEGYKLLERNPKLGNSVLDFLFGNGEPLYIEVKSAVLREGNYAKYPDCPTLRGRRHIEELIEASRCGNKTGIVFIAALKDVEAFSPHDKEDSEIRKLLICALKAGVIVKAVGIFYNPSTSEVILYTPDLPVYI